MEQPVEKDQPVKKKRKPMAPRLIYWSDYDKFEGPDGTSMARCKACKAEIKANSGKNGTSGLINHNATCKERLKLSESKQSIFVKGFPSSDDSNQNVVTTIRCDNDTVRKALVHMIIAMELPFSFTSHPAFGKFMSIICPRFRVPSRWTVQRDMFDLFGSEKEKMKEMFKRTNQRVSFTTDSWTSIQITNYMCLTVHFIDDNWILQKRVISFCPITSHRGKDIGLAIDKCFRDWGIENIFTITVDNASSNDVAMKYLQKTYSDRSSSILKCGMLHVRCVAHILNLILNDGLQLLDESILRIRSAVKHIKLSPKRLSKFKECIKAEAIESKCSLVQDVPTRWNSTYFMLEVAIKFEKAFVRYDHECESFQLELTDDNGKYWVPMKKDWDDARRLVTILKHFYDLTLKVSGSRFITANGFFDEIVTLDESLRDWKDSSDERLSKMATAMKYKYDKYWGDPEKMNMLLFVAVIFDPRVKLDYVELCFADMYKEKANDMFKRVKDALYDLFEDYRKIWIKKNGGIGGENNGESGGIDQVNKANMEKSEMKMLERIQRLNKKRKDAGTSTTDGKSELDKYLNEDREALHSNTKFDILAYWKNNSFRLPILGQMARDILVMPISTVASESVFSTSGRVLDAFRSSLTPPNVEALLCVQDWFRGSYDKVENIFEILDKEQCDEPNDGLARLSLSECSTSASIGETSTPSGSTTGISLENLTVSTSPV